MDQKEKDEYRAKVRADLEAKAQADADIATKAKIDRQEQARIQIQKEGGPLVSAAKKGLKWLASGK